LLEYLTFQKTKNIKKDISLIHSRQDKNRKMGLRNTLRKFCVMKKVRDRADESENNKNEKSKE